MHEIKIFHSQTELAGLIKEANIHDQVVITWVRSYSLTILNFKDCHDCNSKIISADFFLFVALK